MSAYKAIKEWVQHYELGVLQGMPNAQEGALKEAVQVYANGLALHKDVFWSTLEEYKLRCPRGSAPDLQEINKHITRPTEHTPFVLREKDFEPWWDYDPQEQIYRPRIVKRACEPKTGVFQHFYATFVEDPEHAHVIQIMPSLENLRQLLKQYHPFARKVEPTALLVVPSSDAEDTRGTYALVQRLTSGNEVYARPARRIVVEGPKVHLNGVPVGQEQYKYAQTENTLGLSDVQQPRASFTLRLPGTENVADQTAKGEISNLDEDSYEIWTFLAGGVAIHIRTIYPIRTLLAPSAIAALVDYGAVWDGCFALLGTPRTYVTLEELTAHFKIAGFGQDSVHVVKYLFRPAGGKNIVQADDYVRLMDVVREPGNESRPAEQRQRKYFPHQTCYLATRMMWNQMRLVFRCLAAQGGPFSINSRQKLLAASSTPGTYNIRLGTSGPHDLTVEVLAKNGTVQHYRIGVSFTAFQPMGLYTLKEPNNQEYSIEGGVSSLGADGQPSILSRIGQWLGLDYLVPLVDEPVADAVIYHHDALIAPQPAVFAPQEVAGVAGAEATFPVDNEPIGTLSLAVPPLAAIPQADDYMEAAAQVEDVMGLIQDPPQSGSAFMQYAPALAFGRGSSGGDGDDHGTEPGGGSKRRRS